MKKNKKILPDGGKEEYYQISMEIFSSFSKYRPPIDLFQLDEEIFTIFPFSRKGQRLTEEQTIQAAELCEKECLFIAHSDWHLYADHITLQLDLLLLDSNFSAIEVGEVMSRALHKRYSDLFDQPVPAVYDKLYADLMVYSQYIWEDRHRLRSFLRYVHKGDYDPAWHAVNSLFVGTWIFIQTHELSSKRLFDRAILGIFLHDIGMSKVPAFILGKATMLKGDEVEKIREHVVTGVKMMEKLNVEYEEVNLAISEHHERFDGSGYPKKITTQTPIGRITAIADSFSAMVQKRIHKAAKTIDQAIAELSKPGAADSFAYDPALVKPLQNAQDFKLFEKQKIEHFGNLEEHEALKAQKDS